jgi:hypothetical protein
MNEMLRDTEKKKSHAHFRKIGNKESLSDLVPTVLIIIR